ncbi:MAG: transposase [Kofleriaceae bacterium]
MARPRKRHVQTSFLYKKLDKNGQHRGGSRRNAGRKRTGDFASHVSRAAIDKRHPQHVTLRVVPEVGWLRRLDTYAAVRHALRTVLARHEKFRIVHVSVQNTHVHLLVEAEDKRSLADGMRAFQISAAKLINAVYSRRRRLTERRRGRVFADRYFAEDIGSVRQVRNTLSYVLNNWRRHRDDTGSYSLFEGRLDPYASGLAFTGWRELVPDGERRLPRGYEPPEVSAPRTWLLGIGWTRATTISMFETPGPRKVRRVDA